MNRKARRHHLAGTMVLALLTLALPGGSAIAVDAAPAQVSVTYPPDAVVFGKKLNEWSAEWWQYILATPSNPNPLQDPTGNFCTLVQHGPVWFLAGVISGSQGIVRTCSIPEGTALLFPILNIVDINTASQQVDELRAEIKGCMDAATDLLLVVDGKNIPVQAGFRERSVAFVAVLPPSGVPTVPPTPPGIYSPAVDDGFYVMLRPLSVGQHTVRFTGATPGCNYPPTNFHVDPFSVDVTYQLKVEPVTLK